MGARADWRQTQSPRPGQTGSATSSIDRTPPQDAGKTRKTLLVDGLTTEARSPGTLVLRAAVTGAWTPACREVRQPQTSDFYSTVDFTKLHKTLKTHSLWTQVVSTCCFIKAKRLLNCVQLLIESKAQQRRGRGCISSHGCNGLPTSSSASVRLRPHQTGPALLP